MNIFDLPNLPLSQELETVILEKGQVRVERIVSTGQTSGWYCQGQDEFVALLQGRATIEYDGGETVELNCGDTLFIPARRRHRVSYTSEMPPCVWLCMFF